MINNHSHRHRQPCHQIRKISSLILARCHGFMPDEGIPIQESEYAAEKPLLSGKRRGGGPIVTRVGATRAKFSVIRCLSFTKNDTTFRQVVGRQLDANLVSWNDTNKVTAHPA